MSGKEKSQMGVVKDKEKGQNLKTRQTVFGQIKYLELFGDKETARNILLTDSSMASSQQKRVETESVIIKKQESVRNFKKLKTRSITRNNGDIRRHKKGRAFADTASWTDQSISTYPERFQTMRDGTASCSMPSQNEHCGLISWFQTTR